MDRRLPTRLARSLGACASVLVFLLVTGAANASAASNPGHARAAALASLKHLLLGEHGTNHPGGGRVPAASFGPKKVTSGDWSGYADDNSESYTSVTARWKEPAVSCTSTNALAVFWVGIDGYSSATVEQDGSAAYCYQGSAFYYTWWEMAPRLGIQFVGNSVQPGDQIDASVTRNGTKYTLKVSDTTTAGNTFTKYQVCQEKTCANSSAEWVAEAPAGPSGQYPLPDFGTWTVQGAAVKTSSHSGTISSFPDYFITMTTHNDVLARPGPLNGAGNSFSDIWVSSGG